MIRNLHSREQFATRMARYGGEIEFLRLILIRERSRMLDFFDVYLLLRYKTIGALKNLEIGAKIRDLQQINNFESVT